MIKYDSIVTGRSSPAEHWAGGPGVGGSIPLAPTDDY